MERAACPRRHGPCHPHVSPARHLLAVRRDVGRRPRPPPAGRQAHAARVQGRRRSCPVPGADQGRLAALAGEEAVPRRRVPSDTRHRDHHAHRDGPIRSADWPEPVRDRGRGPESAQVPGDGRAGVARAAAVRVDPARQHGEGARGGDQRVRRHRHVARGAAGAGRSAAGRPVGSARPRPIVRWRRRSSGFNPRDTAATVPLLAEALTQFRAARSCADLDDGRR